MAGATRGKDFKIYINTDASPYGYSGSPTWTEWNIVRDVTRNLGNIMADSSIRATEFYLEVPTLTQLTIDAQSVYVPSDVCLQELEAAFYDKEAVEIVVLDGPIGTIGSRGVYFVANVTKFNDTEALEGVGMVDVTLSPSGLDTAHLPARVQVLAPNVLTPMS